MMNHLHIGEPYRLPEKLFTYTIYLVPALYFMSLCFNCIYTAHGEIWRGWQILLWGWLGALGLGTEPKVFAWFANPLLAMTLVFFSSQRFKQASIVGIPCLLLALSSFQLRSIATDNPVEIGNSEVTGYGAGFYMWIACCAIPAVASVPLYIIYENRYKETG
jgi:hypothetical protein